MKLEFIDESIDLTGPELNNQIFLNHMRKKFTLRVSASDDEGDKTELEKKLREIEKEGSDEEAIERMKGNIDKKTKESKEKRKSNGSKES